MNNFLQEHSSDKKWMMGYFLGDEIVAAYVGTEGSLHWSAPALAAAALVTGIVRIVFSAQQGRLLDLTRNEARTDDLTGLPNRRHLNEVMTQALDTHPSRSTALFVVDLDRFKEVNDTFGHDVGDELLRQLAPRLVAAVSPAQVFRLGGDEFAVVVDESTAVEAVALARLVQHALVRPIEVSGRQFGIGASVGVALAPWHGRSPSELLRSADIAMYESKRRSRGPVVYESALDRSSPNRIERMNELRSAHLEDELVVAFQPVIDIASGRVVGAEALVRWNHPEHGVLQPASFLGLAGPAGRSSELTTVVLHRALDACRSWRRMADVTVSINLSGSDVGDPGLLGRLTDALRDYSLPSSALVVEVPETLFGNEIEQSQRFFGALRTIGVGLSIDDYGAGVAGIGQLARLPATELKIDRSLIISLGKDHRSEAIVRSTIELARSLGLGVVAEGVEHDDQLQQLVRLGCERAQGFFTGRETSAAGIEDLVRTRL